MKGRFEADKSKEGAVTPEGAAKRALEENSRPAFDSVTGPAAAAPAAGPIPAYLLISLILSGLLTAAFLALFGFSLREAALGDPSIWVTLSLGTGGVFGTSLIRIRDLSTHAV